MAAMWNWLIGGVLLAALLAPVFGRDLERRGRRMTGRNFGGRRVEEQIFGEPPFFFRDGCEALQFLGVHDGQIEPGLGAVIEEDGIDHFARGGGQAERDIGNPQHRLDVRRSSP